MRYKAVLLDFYGTLVEEDHPLIAGIVECVAAASPLKAEPAAIARAWSDKYGGMCADALGAGFVSQRAIEIESLRALLRDYQVDLDAGDLSAVIYRYWQAPRPFPDTERFLRQLPVPACVVSNIDTEDVRAAIRGLGWDLSLVVTSEDARAYKPRPEPFEAGLRLLGLQLGDVLHIGDSVDADVAGAQALGMDIAWLNRRNRQPPATRPTYTFTCLSDVLSLWAGGDDDRPAQEAC